MEKSEDAALGLDEPLKDWATRFQARDKNLDARSTSSFFTALTDEK